LPRELLLRLLNRLYDRLENHADQLRHNRAPGRPACFRFRIMLVEPGGWHNCTMLVDDQAIPNELTIAAFIHEYRPTR